MKAGADSKTKTRIAIVLGIVAILTVAWSLLSNSGSSTGSETGVAASSGKEKTTLTSESLDPRLRLDLLENSEKVKYEGKGTNIFRAGAEPVEIPKPVKSPLLTNRSDPSKPGYLPPPPPRFP